MRTCVFTCLLVFGIAPWPSYAETLVRGPGFMLTSGDVERELRFRPESMAKAIRSDPAQLKALIDDLYRREALVHEAGKLPLESDVDIHYRLERARKEALVSIVLDRVRATAIASVPDLTARAEEVYRGSQESFRVPERIRVRHILLRAATPELKQQRRSEAERILERIDRGEDFGRLARDLSEDPESADRSGALAAFSRDKMVPAFEEAAFALTKADPVSDIVETRFGLHIIMLDERLPARQRSFDEVKENIKMKLKLRYVDDEVEAWRASVVNPTKATTNVEALEGFVKRTFAETDNEQSH